MQSATDECEFIYIIEIPVKVEVFPQYRNISFHVVQVGRTTGADGMVSRMKVHNGAWHSATCEKEAFWKSKAKASDYTIASIDQFPLIVGVLEREQVEGELVGSVNDREAHVRELVGIKLSEGLVKDLLTKDFVSDRAGKAILTDSSRSNFSITELRLVSADELTGIRAWFQSNWEAKKRKKKTSVTVAEFDMCAAQWKKELRTGFMVRFSCTYTDQTHSRQTEGTTLAVKTVKVAHSLYFVTPLGSACAPVAVATAPAQQRPSSARGDSKETAATSPRPSTATPPSISPPEKETKKTKEAKATKTSAARQSTPSSKAKAPPRVEDETKSPAKPLATKSTRSKAKATAKAEDAAKTPRPTTAEAIATSTAKQGKKSDAKPTTASRARGK